MKKKALVIALSILLLMPCFNSTVYAETELTTSEAGGSYTFYGNGTEGSTTGGVTTETSISSGSSTTGGSGSIVKSPETIQNEKALNAWNGFFNGLSGDSFKRLNGTNTYISDIKISRELLLELMRNNPFVNGGYGNAIDNHDAFKNIGAIPGRGWNDAGYEGSLGKGLNINSVFGSLGSRLGLAGFSNLTFSDPNTMMSNLDGSPFDEFKARLESNAILQSFSDRTLSASEQDILSHIIANNFADPANGGVGISNIFARHHGLIPLDISTLSAWPNTLDGLGTDYRKMIEDYRTELMDENDFYGIGRPGGMSMLDITSMDLRQKFLEDWISGKYQEEYVRKLKEEWERNQPPTPDGETPETFHTDISISDYVDIQHIVEYTVSTVQEGVVYKVWPIEYPGGGMYRWDVEMLTLRYGGASGSAENIKTCTDVLGNPLSKTNTLTYVFNVPGEFRVQQKQNLQSLKVNALVYNMTEYWVLAETGQVIYKYISTGRLGESDTEEGRSVDRNVAYYNAVSGLAPLYDPGTGTTAAGVVVKDVLHTVTAQDILDEFPSAGFLVQYGTIRRK